MQFELNYEDTLLSERALAEAPPRQYLPRSWRAWVGALVTLTVLAGSVTAAWLAAAHWWVVRPWPPAALALVVWRLQLWTLHDYGSALPWLGAAGVTAYDWLALGGRAGPLVVLRWGATSVLRAGLAPVLPPMMREPASPRTHRARATDWDLVQRLGIAALPTAGLGLLLHRPHDPRCVGLLATAALVAIATALGVVLMRRRVLVVVLGERNVFVPTSRLMALAATAGIDLALAGEAAGLYGPGATAGIAAGSALLCWSAKPARDTALKLKRHWRQSRASSGALGPHTNG